MELSRRQTLTVMAISAAAAMPASAAKAVTQPIFTFFESSLDNRGTNKVGVRCTVPVASVTARLINHLGAEVARYQLTLAIGSDPKNGVWVTGPLTGIALGTYTMSYAATSQDGGVSSAQADLFLWLLPEFTLEATPPRISPAQPTVTVDGTVMGRHPVTQALAPIAGLPLVMVADHFDSDLPDPSPVMVTSTVDGRFTARFAPAGNALLSVSTNAPERETLVFERTFWGPAVSVDRVPIRITLNPDATHLNLGQASTANGLLEHAVEGQWRPLTAHVLTGAYFVQGSSENAVPQRVTTDGQGRFRLTTTPPAWGYWIVWFDREPPFYDATSVSSRVVYVRDPVHFEGLRASPTPRPNDGGMWEISGLVSNRRFAPTVVIQFRRTAASAWQELRRVVADTSVGSPLWAFRAEFTPPASGQVRAYCQPSDHSQEAASNVLIVRVGHTRTPTLRKDPELPPPPLKRRRPLAR